MAFLIRTIDFTSSGREIVRDRTHDSAEVTIGRASENDIHLPDLAVEQKHVSCAQLYRHAPMVSEGMFLPGMFSLDVYDGIISKRLHERAKRPIDRMYLVRHGRYWHIDIQHGL